MRTNRNYKKYLFSTVIAFVVSTFLICIPVNAEDNKSTFYIRDAQEVINKAAYYRLLGSAMQQCSRDVVTESTVFNTSQKTLRIFKKDIGSPIEYSYGPFLENKVTGKIAQDGKFYCYEGEAIASKSDSGGILPYFAENTQLKEGWGVIDVVCNEWRHERPGLLAPTSRNNLNAQKISDCEESWSLITQDSSDTKADMVYTNLQSSPKELLFHPDNNKDVNNTKGITPYSDGYEYLKDYWNYYISLEQQSADGLKYKNEYIPEWDATLNYAAWGTNTANDKAALHYIYRRDFETMCTSGQTPLNETNYQGDYRSFINGNMVWLKATNWNKSGQAHGLRQLDGFQIGTNTNFFVLPGTQTTCIDLANKINSTYEAYIKKIAEVTKKDCNGNEDLTKKWNFAKTKADIIIAQNKDSKSQKAVMVGIDGKQYDAGKLTSEQIEDAKKANMFWINYKEVEGEDGNISYELLKFTDKEVKEAQETVTNYNKYGKDHFHIVSNDNNYKDGFICEVPNGDETATLDHEKSDSDSSSGDSDPCYDAGVEGMSWVLCPTINNTAHAMDTFEKALRTMLSIESNKLFGSNTESYKIWETFRNIANVVLIIIFLVIIFSQLTGYGIDNYGIKKMLPKLIVMAVLINLSYILCELAVDLSNILGVGLDNLFRGLAGDYADQTSTYDIVFTLLASVAGAAGAAVYIYDTVTTGGGTALVVALVFALLGAIVIAFLFLAMVGLRMIIVVVFTVISPVAFALYILPNTQSLFKKWWKVFEAALVVYPICGALYGAHYVVKAILLSQQNENFFMGVAAVIGPYLPFVALPSLLKGALAGLGSVSGAITAVGSGLKKGAKKTESAVKGSQAYKNAQQNAQEQRAQNTYSKLKDKLAKGEDLTASQRRRYLRAGAITQKTQKDAEGVYRDYLTTQDRGNVAETLKSSLSGKDIEQAGAAFDTLMAKGGTSEALKALEDADWEHMDAGVQERILRSMAGSNVDAMKGFAKYKGSNGVAGFKNWANNSRTQAEINKDNAANNNNGVKAESYARHLLDNGTNAMDGYSKDEAQFIDSHMAGIQSYMGGSFSKEFGAQLGSAGLHSKDAQAQTVWDKIMKNQLGQTGPNSISASDLGIVADDFRTMREGMGNAIYAGTENYLNSTGGQTTPAAVKQYINSPTELGNQIAAAKASTIIMDSANQNVVNKLF